MKLNVSRVAIIAMLFSACTNNPNIKNLKKETVMNDSSNFQKGYSDVNGIKMYYEIHGQGEPLVLLHGGGSTITTSFGKILPMLSDEFKIIAVELQGHGHTSDRDSPESFEQDADDVAGLLKNLQIPKTSFFGFSNGGNTAMQIAHRHPEIVNKLVIASSLYKREGFPHGFFDVMKKATINDMPQVMRDAFLKINPDSNKLQTMFEKDRQRMISFRDWPDEILSSIKNPTLVICGDKDAISVSHTMSMANLIPGSRLMVLPATHGAYIGVAESPGADEKMIELTASVIKDFLHGTKN